MKVAEDDLPLLGPFSGVLTSLSKVVVPWLPLAPELKRLAFGAALVQPVDNVPAGYVLIQRYLPSMRIDLDGSVSDFFLQINRPRSSTTRIEGLRVNRLMRWSVQVAQRVTVTLGPGGIVSRTLGEEAACRLELDINTVPDFGAALPREQLEALLQEMMDHGREIAQNGDMR